MNYDGSEIRLAIAWGVVIVLGYTLAVFVGGVIVGGIFA